VPRNVSLREAGRRRDAGRRVETGSPRPVAPTAPGRPTTAARVQARRQQCRADVPGARGVGPPSHTPQVSQRTPTCLGCSARACRGANTAANSFTGRLARRTARVTRPSSVANVGELPGRRVLRCDAARAGSELAGRSREWLSEQADASSTASSKTFSRYSSGVSSHAVWRGADARDGHPPISRNASARGRR
jgi:hypothetical protein